MSVTSRILRAIEPWYCRWDRWRTRHWFLKNAKRYPYAHPQRGVTVVGSLETRGSLSKVLRDFVRSLKLAGIPYQTYSTSPRCNVPAADIEGLLTPVSEFRAARFGCVVEMFDSVFPAEDLGLKRATIAFWEFNSGFFEAHPGLLEKRNLVGMSDFNADYYKLIVRDGQRAIKLLYPFRQPSMALPSVNETRTKFGIGADDFAVLYNFDYGSSVGRKNPDGVIRAFAAAFHKVKKTKLVFKTQGASSHQTAAQWIRDLVRELGLENRFVSIDHYVPEADIYALTNACDVYASLHRGEGFGLGVAEAMSFGKPVVVTNYSSTTEFCNEHNSMLVDYTLVPLTDEQRREHPFLRFVAEWAEPDVDAAAAALRELYDDPEKRAQLGAKAREFIAEHFSIENFRRSVETLIG